MSGEARRNRLGILLSGRGSNFAAIARNVESGWIPAEIGMVISNRAGAPGLEMARAMGLPAQAIPSQGMDREAYDGLLVAALREAQVDFVCLAGYMRLLSSTFIRAFEGRILNIHPSLLPAFPGLDAQHQALAHGVKMTGCTVHFVDEQLDAGPIVMQAVVPVRDDDTVETLSARILDEEHRIFSLALRAVLAGEYAVEGRRVKGLDPRGDERRNELARCLAADAAAAPPANILEGLRDEAAHSRVPGVPRTVYEEVWHLAYWQQLSLDWCRGCETAFPATPSDGFPDAADVARESWDAVRRRFLNGCEEAATMAGETLQLERVVRCPSQPGKPARLMTAREQLENLAAHNAYHLGRVVTLRQMLHEWPPASGGFSW